jgi:hypothetical protein
MVTGPKRKSSAMKNPLGILLFQLIGIVYFGLFVTPEACTAQQSQDIPVVLENSFPVCTQFSPLPTGEAQADENMTLTDEMIQATIHDIIGHGFSMLSVHGIPSDPEKKSQTMKKLNYAQSLGMKINYLSGGSELFSREKPSPVSVYSPRYAEEVRKRVESRLGSMKEIENLHSVFPYQDEPFHAHPGSFDYSEETRAEFLKRYGYSMPDSLGAIRDDPVKWLDFLNFQSDLYRDGWLQVYQVVKAFDPRPKIIMTHDSHNTFGAGVKSNSLVGMDDVYHWGGDFADIYIYDIYPYMSIDFRFGDFSRCPKPRISQMHYTIAQMRNLTTTYGKELAFWVGTYNKTWFRDFMGEERRKTYWSEREMSTTAVAHGANFLLTGINIPEDERHWEEFGKSNRILQKAGPGLLDAPKIKANACFLFPRTQHLQLQEEYYNVGLSFELILRAFGELDIIHEEQIRDKSLNGYKVLVLCDVKLLPGKVAEHIEAFVRNGGILIADCVPQMDEYKRPMDGMKNLFGVKQASTDRIIQEGHWVPFTKIDPVMHFPPTPEKEMQVVPTDSIAGRVLGNDFGFRVFGPRACEVSDGRAMLKMVSNRPALISKTAGKGRTYLLGFSLQDTYFQTWKRNNIEGRSQLRSLLAGIFHDAGVSPHIYSSNPDIEASVRANSSEGFVFIINHETEKAFTRVHLGDLEFRPGKILDIESGISHDFRWTGEMAEFDIIAPLGSTKILKLLPATR